MSIFEPEIFPPEADYRARFKQMIDSEFYNLELDEVARRSVSELAERGAKELSQSIFRERATGRRRELYVERAEANLGTILRRIREQMREKNEKKLTVETFNTVMRGICPLWPFC